MHEHNLLTFRVLCGSVKVQTLASIVVATLVVSIQQSSPPESALVLTIEPYSTWLSATWDRVVCESQSRHFPNHQVAPKHYQHSESKHHELEITSLSPSGSLVSVAIAAFGLS
jgi:hypothetical protein